MTKNYYFFIALLLCSISGFSQSNYEVNPIPFQQYTGDLPVQFTIDDTFSNPIFIPFEFNFYGINYNSLSISTNGYVSFSGETQGTFSPWNFTQTIPNANFPVKNSILGAYHDMYNSNAQGTITYGTYGAAPNRKFVVYFNNNALFQCSTSYSSFQMILYETNSIIDVQLIDKQNCPTWNGGRTVTGLIDLTGTQAITPPNRNTGQWTAFHEGWRFSRPNFYSNYYFVKCDDDTDGLVSFDLAVAQNDLFTATSNVTFYTDSQLTDVITNPTAYTNLSNPQTIYAAGNGIVKSVNLSVIDCSVDYDNDTVSTDLEDANADTNLANDDTDNDGLPNYLDNDDDGDLVLTNLEYVFPRNTTAFVDTDGDGIQNYLDNDDDGDGILTFMEDANGDGNPTNDDSNANGTPDYLDNPLLAINQNAIENIIKIFPNPTSSFLNIENLSNQEINSISVYSIKGDLVKSFNSFSNTINVSNLQAGIYFIKIEMEKNVINYKFIKN